MTDYFQNIYANHAHQYERLVSREDQHGNLFAALMDIHPFSGATVAEFGAGTGRVTRIMSVLAKHILAFDRSPAMLAEAKRIMSESGMTNWQVAVADNRAVPLASNHVDISVEGWSFGHVMGWYGEAWQTELDRMLAEMQRVTRTGGTMILIETMGTGHRQPQAPSAQLESLYAYFQELGFEYRWIRTDYQFESVQEADELMRFFFGDEMADQLVGGTRLMIPECTGIWWKTAS